MFVHRGYTIIATVSTVAAGVGAFFPIYTVLSGGTTGPVVHQDSVPAEFPDEAHARKAAIDCAIAWIDKAFT